MANNQIVISRIQHRRGLKENLPQPLLPGEIALTVDTGELWIGTSRDQPPFGVRTYGSGAGDIALAESIADTQVAVAKFVLSLTETEFESLVDFLTDSAALTLAGAPAVVLTEDDILWDGDSAVFIAADIAVDANNTISNVLLATSLSVIGSTNYNPVSSNALGAINLPYITSTATSLTFADDNPDTITYTAGPSDFVTDGFQIGQTIFVSGSASNDTTVSSYYTIANVTPTVITLDVADSLVAETVAATLQGRWDPLDPPAAFDPVNGDFQFGSAFHIGNAQQGANAARLINALNGAGIVTTFGNLQITTSGIGVGSSTFRDMTVTDTDIGFTWSSTGTASADSTVDELTFVGGENINIDVDTVSDAIRISSTAEADPDKLFSGFLNGITQFTLTGGTAVFTDVTGLNFDLDDESDVIFVEYSGNIDGATPSSDNYTVMGKMEIVASNLTDAGLASLNDEQNEVRDGALVGSVAFQATYVAGSPNRVQVQYTNTFTEDVVIRTLRRRWMSF